MKKITPKKITYLKSHWHLPNPRLAEKLGVSEQTLKIWATKLRQSGVELKDKRVARINWKEYL